MFHLQNNVNLTQAVLRAVFKTHLQKFIGASEGHEAPSAYDFSIHFPDELGNNFIHINGSCWFLEVVIVRSLQIQ